MRGRPTAMDEVSSSVRRGPAVLEWTPPNSDGIKVPKWEFLREEFPKLKEASK
jgi:hypothetical protein